jgi:hypothetical protein
MTFTRRLRKIETSLTPKQAVLLWLKETRELTQDEFLEKTVKSSSSAPRNRIPNQAEQAVRDNLRKQAVNSESIARAALEAWKEADFLVVLLMQLYGTVDFNRSLNVRDIFLLKEMFHRMLEQFAVHDQFDADDWNLWRKILIHTLDRLGQLRAVTAEISEQYYDGNPILFVDDERSLDEDVRAVEKMAKEYNSLKEELPRWTAIDLHARSSSIAVRLPALVGQRVAFAKAKTLQALGDWRGAWQLQQPTLLCTLRRFRRPKSKRNRAAI